MCSNKIRELESIPDEPLIEFCPKCDGLTQIWQQRCELCDEKNPLLDYQEPDPFETELLVWDKDLRRRENKPADA